jgi:hypothetical protein
VVRERIDNPHTRSRQWAEKQQVIVAGRGNGGGCPIECINRPFIVIMVITRQPPRRDKCCARGYSCCIDGCTFIEALFMYFPYLTLLEHSGCIGCPTHKDGRSLELRLHINCRSLSTYSYEQLVQCELNTRPSQCYLMLAECKRAHKHAVCFLQALCIAKDRKAQRAQEKSRKDEGPPDRQSSS